MHKLTNDPVLYNIKDTDETTEAVPEIHYTHNQFRAMKGNETDEQMFHRMCRLCTLNMDYNNNNNNIYLKS